MVLEETINHLLGETRTRLMKILSYKVTTTKDFLTSRAGLICVGQLMESLGFSEAVDKYFPLPRSNRGYKPSVFVNSFMLMLHEGGRCLDDLRHIRQDEALRLLLGIKKVPESDSLGDWLRRLGLMGVDATSQVNKILLKQALHKIKNVTLDIDATLSASKNQFAKWTYKKVTGYMPMVGHIAETGQVVSTEFREGNVSPSSNNLEFIHQCEAALPSGVSLAGLRIDAAGYQAAILDECVARQMKFAIRVKMNQGLKKQIKSLSDTQWQPLIDRTGQQSTEESTTRFIHAMEKSHHSFTIVVQRRLIKGQEEMDLGIQEGQETIRSGQYLYRAIAVSESSYIMSDSDWIHWYNQRGEHSENRIKELKADFAASVMPCRDFDANALYFSLCSLAYNLFALLRMYLPAHFESTRAKTFCWRIFAMAGKVVRHGRKIFLKLKKNHQALLNNILLSLKRLAHSP